MKPRALTSLTLALSFLIMGLTGLVLYILPQGRVAYWNEWRLLWLTKGQWDDMHIISSWVFLLTAPFHIWFNWRPLMGHIRARVKQVRTLRRELMPTTGLAVLIVASAIYHVPPLSFLLDLNAWAKDQWSAEEPPFGHAEEVSLSRLVDRMDVPLPDALAALKAANVKVDDPKAPLEDIAHANGLSPAQAYAPIALLVPRMQVAADQPLTDARVAQILEGGGIGQKTLSSVCEQLGQRPEDCTRRLTAQRLPADLEQRVRTVSDAAGLRPIEVVQRMAVDR